jgi:hypothetical protein
LLELVARTAGTQRVLVHGDVGPKNTLGALGPGLPRCAVRLPAFLLARIDGKSPVQYVTGEAQRNPARAVAIALRKSPVASLADVMKARVDALATA